MEKFDKNNNPWDEFDSDTNPWDEFEISEGEILDESEKQEILARPCPGWEKQPHPADTDFFVKAGKRLEDIKEFCRKRKLKVAAGVIGLLLLTEIAIDGCQDRARRDSENAADNLHDLNLQQGIEETIDLEDDGISEGTIDGTILGDAKPSGETATQDTSSNEQGASQPTETKPELSWIDSYNAEAGTQVTGPALIEKDTGWVKVNAGETHTLEHGGHVNTYSGNQAGLDAEYNRVLAAQDTSTAEAQESTTEPESPSLKWLDSYNAEAGTQITGPALVEKDSGWFKINVGETHTLSEGGHVNTYEGNQVGLISEFHRLAKERAAQEEAQAREEDTTEKETREEPKEEAPSLTWNDSYSAEPGTQIAGPALIEKDTGWVKVNVGETHTLNTGGHVNTYEGNQAGLDAEYNRVSSQKQQAEEKSEDPIEKETETEQPELTWLDSYNAEAGTQITGPALIETDAGWIRVYAGETHTLEKSGSVNKYEGNNAGLDAEHKRVTESE